MRFIVKGCKVEQMVKGRDPVSKRVPSETRCAVNEATVSIGFSEGVATQAGLNTDIPAQSSFPTVASHLDQPVPLRGRAVVLQR